MRRVFGRFHGRKRSAWFSNSTTARLMRYLLDTNICIFLINCHPKRVQERFRQVPVELVAVSSVTTSELRYGVAKSAKQRQNAAALQKFFLPLSLLSYDDEASQEYGRLRLHLEREGKSIGAMDTMIAAHALSLDLTVVTNNTREFSRVPDLRVEDWSESVSGR